VDDIPEPGTTVDLKTRKGKTIKGVDLVVSTQLCVLRDDNQTTALHVQIPAFGAKPNTAFIESLGSGTLTSTGFVKIKPTLELLNHPGIFAIGDILDWPEQKQAGKVMAHAGIVAANLLSYLEGKPQKKLYKGPMAEAIVVPIGKVWLLQTCQKYPVLMLSESRMVRGTSVSCGVLR
jgi:apoptosis-inducing factor 2